MLRNPNRSYCTLSLGHVRYLLTSPASHLISLWPPGHFLSSLSSCFCVQIMMETILGTASHICLCRFLGLPMFRSFVIVIQCQLLYYTQNELVMQELRLYEVDRTLECYSIIMFHVSSDVKALLALSFWTNELILC